MPRAAKGGRAAAPAPSVTNGQAISQIIGELLAKQQRLGELVDLALAEAGIGDGADAGLPLEDLARLLALYAQTASRLGSLLRDQRALSDTVADELAMAIDQARESLLQEWEAAR